jgi:glycosyltransferase involved in cell wall biosynthesis
LPVFRANFGTGISSGMIFLSFLIWIMINRMLGRKILLQTRSKNLYRILKRLKKIFPSIHIVFENRGAAAEEFLNSMNYKMISEVMDRKVIRQYNLILDMELKSCEIADYVLCVSEKLRDYLLSHLKVNADDSLLKYIVTPGAADENHFMFVPATRDTIRYELGFDKDKKVVVYTGRLNCHWHKGEDMFSIMGKCLGQNRKMVFMCITPDTDMAENMKAKYNIPGEQILIRYVKYDDINEYLNGADFGLLLRDDIPTNQVASPTKVPEYLLSGLPVLISGNVGDYSLFIENERCGFVLPAGHMEAVDTILRVINQSLDRNEIAQKGRKYYSKQSQLDKLLSVYNRI